MLKIESQPGGSVEIEGDATDLLALGMWLKIAIERGTAITPGFRGVDNPDARIEITCTEPIKKAAP